MSLAIQDTLLQHFEHVRHDPDSLPAVPIDRWQQESLHNTVKHARASKIDLRLHQTGKAVILEVCGNGRLSYVRSSCKMRRRYGRLHGRRV